MTVATLSPKFQVVVPKQVRKSLNISAGMKFQVLPYGNHIELIPMNPISGLKGLLPNIDTNIIREKDRSL